MSGTVLTTRFSKKDIETMENLIKKNAIQADKLGITHEELITKAKKIGAKVYEEEYGDN